MTKAMAKVMGTASLASCCVASPSRAEPGHRPSVLVRVYDYAHLSAGALEEVRLRVSEVYGRVGIELHWAYGGDAKIDHIDARVRVDVMVLDGEMTDRLDRDPSTFGRAGHTNKRAYVYHDRVAAHARRHGGTIVRGVALVMAHELGHALLPEYNHTRTGLMQARWKGPLHLIPDFTPAQAAAIRSVASVSRQAPVGPAD